MNKVILKKGREKSILRKHPWIYSGAVARVDGNPVPGEVVTILSSNGELLGHGAFNPNSSIRIRMWCFVANNLIDQEFIHQKMRIAITESIELIPENVCNARRLIFGESDGLPGLIVDQYHHFLVCQFLTAGIEIWRDVIISGLVEITGIPNIYERSDLDVRLLEGLEPRVGVLAGSEPPDLIEISENGSKIFVDIKGGQKTGFYLDQRSNRKTIQKYVHEKDILNCFCYTGGFTIDALFGGAKSVTSIDSSSDAIELAKKNVQLNNFNLEKSKWIEGDVFKELRLMRDRDESFDLVILDPPKFAPTSAQVRAASRGYKDINLLAFKLLRPGGILITFSCSSGIKRDLFQKIVADAAIDANVDASILEYLSQDRDHPIALNFPESEYLKGLVCKIK